VNRWQRISLGLAAAALVAVVTGIFALHSSRGNRPATQSDRAIISIDPCSVPSPDVPTWRDGQSSESVARVTDANQTAVREPNDAERTVADSESIRSIREASNVSPASRLGGTIRGRVLRPDGTPYVETMELIEMLRVRVQAPGYERACGIDDAGRFECTGLDAGRYAVTVVDSPDPHRILCHGVLADVSPKASSEEVVLVLGPETTVTVRALSDPDLQPVKACSVVMESTRGPAVATGKTDGQGLCPFGLVTGSYRVYVLTWDQEQSIEVSPTLVTVKAPGPPMTVELLLPQREPEKNLIDIALVDLEGRPLPGLVTLEAVVSDPNAEPAARFSLPEPTFQPPGGLVGSACDASGLLGRRFIWRKDSQNTEMTLVLEPGATIAGRVIGVDRKPVPGARIGLETLMLDNRWSGLGDPLFAATTDDDGYFQLQDVSVGPRVRATAFLGTLSGRSRSLDLQAADIADAGEIVLTGSRPGSGIVGGRITDEHDLPVANRAIKVGIGRASQNLVTDADGCYALTDMPTDRPLTITIDVPTYGVWSRTAVADDYACDFQVVPQGWGALGQEAPPLVADTWFNHAPITLKEVRGRVVLLTFRNFTMDRDAGLATIRSLLTEFGSKGLLVVAVYDHLPGGNPVAEDIVTTHLTSLFEGASIAGVLDSDPDLVADLMPPGRPPGVTAGATHWLYQVHERPASFLIDKKGIVRFCEPRENNLRERIVKLLEE